jgi:NAD(P)-dependent dehydrogenase (short-subunit alcohol dehydrogenase family)
MAGFDLTGTVALVTRGNSGIGRGMADARAAAGAAVCVQGRTETNGQAAERLRKHGRPVLALACDVADESAGEAAFTETVATLGRVDACFVNAGVSGRKEVAAFTDMTAAEWRRVMSVNLDGAFFTWRAAARHMTTRAGGGSLVVTASLACHLRTGPRRALRGVQGGIISMMKSRAVELARHGIRANAVLPGWIDTPMTDTTLRWDRFVDKVLPRIPMRRWGVAEDFGGIAVYLTSDQRRQRLHTGDMFVIDRGYSSF